jgi:hypothetical protein
VSEATKLSERQLGVIDYFVERIRQLQEDYADTHTKFQQYVTDAAKVLGIDVNQHQFDPTTGEFTPLPEPSVE